MALDRETERGTERQREMAFLVSIVAMVFESENT